MSHIRTPDTPSLTEAKAPYFAVMRALLDLDAVDVGEPPFAAGFVSILKMHCGGEASIWKLDDLSRLVLVASTDITAKEHVKAVNSVGLTKGQGVSGQAVLERRTISFHGNASRHQHDARVDSILRKDTRSMLSAPIALDARCVHGVLNLINPPSGLSRTDLMDVMAAAATLYAFRLAEAGRYGALTHNELAREFSYIRHAPDSPIAKTIEQCVRYAPYDDAIFLLGETGTGKELFARLIHEASGRTGPKVDVNCSLLRPERMESELYGHVKGAFTGADRDYEGKFEAAVGGTIFLDEIGELAPECQPGFLRVIQEKNGQRMGDSTKRHYDARVVAATRRTTTELLRQQLLREDLWERLCRFAITIPPLRERPMDIPFLTAHFIEKYSTKYNVTAPHLSKGAAKRMQTYSWERNVRQLENVIARAVVDYPGMEVDETALERLFLKQGDEVRPEFLLASPPETTRAVRTGMTEEESILQAMRAPQNLMKNGRPNLSRVARALRMDRHTLPRKLLQYRIDKVSLDGE